MDCSLLSWNESEKLLEKLSKKIMEDSYCPDLVIGISRGGVIPARIICDKLRIHNLISIKAEHWGMPGKVTQKARVTHGISMSLEGKKALLVDDLTDTGESLEKCVEHVNPFSPAELRTAVIHHKPSSKFVPDYYAEKMGEWKWVIYPWMFNEDISEFIMSFLNKEMAVGGISSKLMAEYGLEISDVRLMGLLQDLEHFGKIKRRIKNEEIYWVKK